MSLFLIQCAPNISSSSGFMIGTKIKTLPEGIPKRIGVSLFWGKSPINIQATDQFSAGLVALGFDVVERAHIAKVFNELEIQFTGAIDEKMRKELGRQYGLEAIFVGSVTGESSPMWVDSHLNVKLVDIETGRVIWSITANDPR